MRSSLARGGNGVVEEWLPRRDDLEWDSLGRLARVRASEGGAVCSSLVARYSFTHGRIVNASGIVLWLR